MQPFIIQLVLNIALKAAAAQLFKQLETRKAEYESCFYSLQKSLEETESIQTCSMYQYSIFSIGINNH